jgi:hypothetical protein
MTGENVYLLLSIFLLSLCVGISLGLINVLCVDDVGARAICGFWPRNDLRIALTMQCTTAQRCTFFVYGTFNVKDGTYVVMYIDVQIYTVQRKSQSQNRSTYCIFLQQNRQNNPGNI